MSVYNIDKTLAKQEIAKTEFSKEVYLGWLRYLKNYRLLSLRRGLHFI